MGEDFCDGLFIEKKDTTAGEGAVRLKKLHGYLQSATFACHVGIVGREDGKAWQDNCKEIERGRK